MGISEINIYERRNIYSPVFCHVYINDRYEW